MDIFSQNFFIKKEDREKNKNQKSCTIWLTGLSGSGKSTIANLVDKKLYDLGYHSYILDGDNTRLDLNKDLGFSEKDRIENIRRVSEVSKLLNDAGIITISSFISPFEINRKQAREIIGEDFIEIFIKTDLEICEMRDPKGLYKKARLGEIKDFTGISSPYEIPKNAIILENNEYSDIEKNVNFLIDYLQKNNYLL